MGKLLQSKNIKETENLALAITPENYTRLKQILEYLTRMIDIKLELKEPEPSNNIGHFIDGRFAEITLDGKCIGHIGEIHPRILKNWKIKMPVTLFEINIEDIFKTDGGVSNWLLCTT